MIPVFKRSKTILALDSAATGIGHLCLSVWVKISFSARFVERMMLL